MGGKKSRKGISGRISWKDFLEGFPQLGRDPHGPWVAAMREFPDLRGIPGFQKGIPGFQREFQVGKRRRWEWGSVQETLAGFFPAARRAPLVPVFDAVNLAAFLGFAADFSGRKREELWGFFFPEFYFFPFFLRIVQS